MEEDRFTNTVEDAALWEQHRSEATEGSRARSQAGRASETMDGPTEAEAQADEPDVRPPRVARRSYRPGGRR